MNLARVSLAFVVLAGSHAAQGLTISADRDVARGRSVFLSSGVIATEFDWQAVTGMTYTPGQPGQAVSLHEVIVTLPDLTTNRIVGANGHPAALNFRNWVDGTGYDGPGPTAVADLAINDVESFDIEFGKGHRSVGLAIITGTGNIPNQVDLQGATFRFTALDASGGSLGTADFELSAGVVDQAWLTITCNAPFRKLQVREIDAPTISDQYFSNILTSETAAAAVPGLDPMHVAALATAVALCGTFVLVRRARHAP